jgi:lipopolysaccharide cholinephosphotransferase
VKEYDLSGNCVGLYGIREIMPFAVYGKPTLYKFEDTEVYGVEDYDEYLTRLYKDWRQPPPEEKRVSRHDYLYLDLEKSYLGEK